MTGRIFQLNCSNGGVPKLAVREAFVSTEGLTCDRQEHRPNHGGPERALCLFSLERILELQAEGHPIFPGSTGENITVIGLTWENLVPGSRIALGGEVVIEISGYTIPCSRIQASFLDGNFSRIDHRERPRDSRLSARILQTGNIAVGERVILLNGKLR
jgi:MOSC domain-containing protein YiiM